VLITEEADEVNFLPVRYTLDVSPDLKTEVSIKASDSTTSDTGTVKIYNPNDRTINFITPSTGGIIEIYAGYKGSNGLIFRGNVGRSNDLIVSREGTDVMMSLKLGSYVEKISSAYVRQSFDGQVSSEQIIRSALDAARISHRGLHEAFFTKISDTESVYNELPVVDYVFSGKVVDLIKIMMGEMGLSAVGIQARVENEMYVFSNSTHSPEQRIHIVSARTGLLDSPRWKQEDGTKVFKFKCMMDYEISVGSVVEIVSSVDQRTNGRYVVKRIEYDLSNHDGDFSMDVEARPWEVSVG
jgi:hypothetical protein